MEACHYLDTGNSIERDTGELSKHVTVFFKFAATKPQFLTCMQLMTMHGCALLSGGGWGLQAASVTRDMQAWAEGFPASQDVRKFYTDQMREWLRDPDDVSNLIEAVKSLYLQRFDPSNAPVSKKQSWVELTTAGIASKPIAPKQEQQRAPKMPMTWDTFNPSSRGAIAKKPKRSWDDVARKDSLPQFEELQAESASEQEAEVGPFVEWPQSAVQTFHSWAINADEKRGVKGEAVKIADYVGELEKVPFSVRSMFGLATAVDDLKAKRQVPKNIKTYIDRMKTMAGKVGEFYDAQQGRGASHASGVASSKRSWDEIQPTQGKPPFEDNDGSKRLSAGSLVFIRPTQRRFAACEGI